MLRINQLKALCPSTKSSHVHLLRINRSGEKRKQTHYFCFAPVKFSTSVVLSCEYHILKEELTQKDRMGWKESRTMNQWKCCMMCKWNKERERCGKTGDIPPEGKKIVVETWQMSSNFWSAVKRKRESIELFIVTVEARIRINVRL